MNNNNNNNNNKIVMFMDGKEAVSREEMVMRFGSGYKAPSYNVLAGRYMAAKIARVLASVRDEAGRRIFLAKRSGGKIEYVNIEKCTDISSPEHIRNRIKNDISGCEASLEKVDLRIKDIRQLSISDLPPNGEDAA